MSAPFRVSETINKIYFKLYILQKTQVEILSNSICFRFSKSLACLSLVCVAASPVKLLHCVCVGPEDKNIRMSWDAQNSRNSLWKSAQIEGENVEEGSSLLPSGLPSGEKAPLWAEQFAQGQRTRAYELADISVLMKTRGLLHCPLTHTSLSSLEKSVKL